MLFIALVVLVAMALAGIAMVRSVDTSLGIAGNLAFREAALHSTDQGVASAYAYIAANVANLSTSDPTNAYFASLASDPDWFSSANWGGAVDVYPAPQLTDSAGNRVRYVIHRMCDNGGNCVFYTPPGGVGSGSTMAVGNYQFQGAPQHYYRVTSRVDGPRGTVSITQTFVITD